MSATPDKKTAKKSAPRTEMPVQPPFARIRNYLEVALGYGEADAVAEARRCLQCKKPLCRQGCPVEIDIRGFIGQLQKGDLPGAYKVLREYNSLPAVCGRVCPQETQCEGMCILGKNPEKTGGAVAIGRLERYVADTFAQRLGEGDAACLQITGEAACRMTRDDLKVACIGAGPASLTVAGYLAALGVKVTVYEALHEVGGVLVYGIPEFRLPKDIVRREVLAMQELGVEFKTNWVGGKSVTVQELQDQGFQAVFLGVGAGLPQFLKVPGENSIGVFSANEYLTRVNLGRAYDFPNHDTPIFKADNVAVIGAGNVAMDAARTALRQALSHLLDNALKFTPSGRVLLGAEPDAARPGGLVFRVEDTGIGIPPDKRRQVFEAFVQADASITRTFGGAGLGLAIASKLAARLGGAVEARERPGGGTVMLLTVPRGCPAEEGNS